MEVVGSLVHSGHKAWENNRQVDMFCCYHQLPLTKAPLATSVRARANLGGNGWSLGRGNYMLAEAEVGALRAGGWVSYCKSSNKAIRLQASNWFLISGALILPASIPALKCHLLFKGLLRCSVEEMGGGWG